MTTNGLPEYDRDEAIRIAMSVKDEDIDLSDMPELGGVDPSCWKRPGQSVASAKQAERKKQKYHENVRHAPRPARRGV
jgi:hypothetical protein